MIPNGMMGRMNNVGAASSAMGWILSFGYLKVLG